MKLVRFAWNGGIHEGVYEKDQIVVGSVVFNPDDVMFLPPIDNVGKALGVALGFAKHAR